MRLVQHVALMSLLASLLSPGETARAGDPVDGVQPAGVDAPERKHFDPVTGYRISRYRAPQPQTIDGAQRVEAADIEKLITEEQAILIDVMPSDGAGLDRQTGRWRLIKPHLHIPGSHWLPDVGYGALDPLMTRYFADNLERLTNGDKTRALVLYCQADCWMSWNAVRRARALGYTRLYWFAEGTDGWRDWDLPLVQAEPVPVTSP